MADKKYKIVAVVTGEHADHSMESPWILDKDEADRQLEVIREGQRAGTAEPLELAWLTVPGYRVTAAHVQEAWRQTATGW